MWTATWSLVSILYRPYIDPQNNPSKSFLLHPLSLPASHFHPLFYCNSPPSPHLLYYLLPKQLPIPIYILIHLPSKLFIYFPFPLIYSLFNLSLFSFVNFYISAFYDLFPSSQYHTTSFLSTATSTTSLSLGSFPPPSLSHTPLLHCPSLPVSPASRFSQHFCLHFILLSCSKDTYHKLLCAGVPSVFHL